MISVLTWSGALSILGKHSLEVSKLFLDALLLQLHAGLQYTVEMFLNLRDAGLKLGDVRLLGLFCLFNAFGDCNVVSCLLFRQLVKAGLQLIDASRLLIKLGLRWTCNLAGRRCSGCGCCASWLPLNPGIRVVLPWILGTACGGSLFGSPHDRSIVLSPWREQTHQNRCRIESHNPLWGVILGSQEPGGGPQ